MRTRFSAEYLLLARSICKGPARVNGSARLLSPAQNCRRGIKQKPRVSVPSCQSTGLPPSGRRSPGP